MAAHTIIGEPDDLAAEVSQMRKFREYYPTLPPASREPGDYFQRLYDLRLSLIAAFYRGEGAVLDLCCGDGEYLPPVAQYAEKLLAVDFSPEALETARKRTGDLENVELFAGNARELPLTEGSIELVYSFSSLYAIPAVDAVIGECARCLADRGIAVFDFGLQSSLNTLVVGAHNELAAPYHISWSKLCSLLVSNQFEVLQHRSFQVLPLWGSKPRWLRPLLHPVWKKVLSIQVRQTMLDEWISSLPLLRRFAFRHLIVCRKRSQL